MYLDYLRAAYPLYLRNESTESLDQQFVASFGRGCTGVCVCVCVCVCEKEKF